MRITKLTALLAIIFMSQAAGQSSPAAVARFSEINFGYMPQMGKTYFDFYLISQSEGPIFLGNSKTFCECLQVEFPDTILAPKDSARIRLHFFSGKLTGEKLWVPAIYDRNKSLLLRLDVRAEIIPRVEAISPLYVYPPMVNASQFRDSTAREYYFDLINTSPETVPLKFLWGSQEFYDIEFPGFVDAGDTARGKIILNDLGLKGEFEESFTFELINSGSERIHYTVPVKRRIYRP